MWFDAEIDFWESAIFCNGAVAGKIISAWPTTGHERDLPYYCACG
jgi:hypothetical protein